ncbi:hypothetical protein EDD16DRAFT_1519129 [Pisolithus croceorrhizus]|nr:hypothetical protein EV401DRAFT_1893919 [Pisolithus croceorrhizus]KAI6119993.1 hypothetical protein EDD16DRAFT_1519129 [Pisolithus croceorrhizus]KAI6167999.1 hypothetical protein EDD17DRAFT_1503675 [Pisolithus thermaeus]
MPLVCSSFSCPKAIQNHYAEKHKGKPKESYKCKPQKLCTWGFGPYHRLWEVEEPTQERKHSHEDLANKLMKDIEKDLKVVAAPSDACLVSGWRELVSLPTAEETQWETQWKGLRGDTEAYFKKVVNLIDHTDTLILKHLNSPDPVKQ